jgi:Chaperone of endosialidase
MTGKLSSKWHEGILLVVAAIAFAAVPPAAQSQVVRGRGTTNVVPRWTSSSTIGNSALSQSGSNLTASGSITATSFAGDGSALSNVNAAKLGGILPSGFAQLGAASNVFSGTVSAATINSDNPYQIGGTNVLSVAGTQNLFVGQSAGASNTGSGNTGTGFQALFSNTGGFNNTAAGDGALYSNTTGEGNTAAGVLALKANTTGNANTAAGLGALFSSTTGSYNSAAGFEALLHNTTGNSNTAAGFEALLNTTTGSGNTAIGNSAGSGLTGGDSNNIDINHGGFAGDSGVIRIGTAGTQTATYIAAIYGVTTGSPAASSVFVDLNGQLGTLASSRRYKEDILDMGNSSDGLLRLRPVTFRYKKPYADGSKPIQFGLIAEEVAEVYPDLVVRGKDGQPETVQYYKLDAMLLNEVQKLARVHAADQAELAQLQSQIVELRKQAQQQEVSMRQLLSQVHSIQVTLASSRSAASAVARTAPPATEATESEVAETSN